MKLQNSFNPLTYYKGIAVKAQMQEGFTRWIIPARSSPMVNSSPSVAGVIPISLLDEDLCSSVLVVFFRIANDSIGTFVDQLTFAISLAGDPSCINSF